MKKIITLVLAVALLMTSVMAFAETKGTPNINSFAKMTTKTDEKNGIITITMSKMVDRLLVNWTDKGAEPEELALDENMQATAIIWGHEKAMPGTKQTKGSVTWTNPYKEILVNPDGAEEAAYEFAYGEDGDGDIYLEAYEEAYEAALEELEDEDLADAAATLAGLAACVDFAKEVRLEVEKMNQRLVEAAGATATVVAPSKTYLKDVEGKSYILDVNGDKIVVDYKDGLVYTAKKTSNPAQTRKAYPADHAYLTVQGDWAVYYNRAGKIVGVELFEGQF